MPASPYLITGGAGQLARELERLLPGSLAPHRADLSVTDPRQLSHQLALVQPEVVFNCAAYNAVDRAEDEPEVALAVNAIGVENLVRACREVGARLVHFSTNYVFDGTATRPYLEADEPNPRGAYARSKREGELRALELAGTLVIRSSGLFGHGGSAIKGGSLPHRLIERARSGDELAVVADQWLNPTFTGHLAQASIAAARDGKDGILHLVASGCCSFHEFALGVLEVAGINHAVTATRTSPESDRAQRPRNGCLASSRFAALPSWREGLAAYWAGEISASGNQSVAGDPASAKGDQHDPAGGSK